ncbi:MAG: FAD-dependent oxidoreductase [Erythrobacter sp.]|jgi:NADH dehydrogenase/putative oxidoreductase
MTETPAPKMQDRLPRFLRVTARRWVKLYRGYSDVSWTLADLFTRVMIAQAFLRSGLVKLADWDTALLLAANEYPVGWMAPHHAALAGLLIEVVGPVLLAIGFQTRLATLAMAALLAVSQAVYVPTTSNLFLIALLGWYALAGAGPLSLDRLLAQGLKDSALPLARQMTGLGELLLRRGAPVWMLVLRLWLALSLLAAAQLFDPGVGLATWLATTSFAEIPALAAAALAVPLVLGLGTSVVALLLAFVVGLVMMAGLHPDVTFYPILLLVLYEARGPGFVSVDMAIERWFDRNVLFDRNYRDIPESWPHVVIVGAGFGGLAATNRLKQLPVRITLIDRRNYHLFQPLLYQVATATLNPADIAIPIRTLFRDDGNVRVIMGEVKQIDPEAQCLIHDDDKRLSYDHLILATGASHSYFGMDQWGKFAPGLKRVEDAVAVRAAILGAFEQAEASSDPAHIRRLLNFVIVGGGATGVELAGAIAELARVSVSREFRSIDPATAHVVLVQSGPRVLRDFADDLSAKAQKSLERLGVEVLTNSRVTAIAADHVRIGKQRRIETETVLWAAGVVASPAASWLGCEADEAGRIAVDEHLRVKGHANIFAIGDTAASMGWAGKSVPGLAPAAKQAGVHVARLLEAELCGTRMPPPFAYDHKGSLATIGRRAAVADLGWLKLSGAPAWWLWGVVHIGFLSGLRNRATVAINWLWSYFADSAGVRLITERETAA